MSAKKLVVEAFRSLRSAPVLLVLVASTVALGLITVGLTAGQTAASEQRISEQLRSPSSRVAAFSLRQTVSLTDAQLSVFAARSDVQGIVATGPVDDLLNTHLGPGSTHIPTRRTLVVGDASLVEHLNRSTTATGVYRSPATHNSLVGELYDPKTLTTYAVVGSVQLGEALQPLEGTALRFDETASSIEARQVYVFATEAESVQAVSDALLPLFDSADVSIEVPDQLDLARRAIEGELNSFSRSLLLVVIASGSSVIALIVVSWSLSHQVEFGRRRALGAGRRELTILTSVQVGYAAVAGALVGGLILGGLETAGVVTTLPPFVYLGATSWLFLVASVLGAAVPATILSRRDPVRILRTA